MESGKLTNDYILAIMAGKASAETKLRAERLTTGESSIFWRLVLWSSEMAVCLTLPSRHGNATPSKLCGSGVTNALRSCFGVRHSQLARYAGWASRSLRRVRNLFAQKVWANAEKKAVRANKAATGFQAQAMIAPQF